MLCFICDGQNTVVVDRIFDLVAFYYGSVVAGI